MSKYGTSTSTYTKKKNPPKENYEKKTEGLQSNFHFEHVDSNILAFSSKIRL